MGKILYHKNFIKKYRKRILAYKDLDNQFQKRFKLFLSNPKNPLLKDHRLIGEKENFRAFSVSGNIRVIYKIVKQDILLLDVGTHNQVY